MEASAGTAQNFETQLNRIMRIEKEAEDLAKKGGGSPFAEVSKRRSLIEA